jgi:hypothetical protein
MKRILLGLLLSLPLAANAAITWRFTGTAATAADGGAVVPTLGGTTNSGDLATCAVSQKNGTDYNALAVSGWTLSYGKTNSGGGTVALLTKITGAGEADPTINSTDNTAGRSVVAQCAVWTGTLDTTTGIVAHSNSAENSPAFSITMPTLTVTTDNTLILSIAGKANDWNAENPIIGASDALTELGQPERAASPQVGLVWAYRIQTTAANVTTGDVTLTENSANAESIIVSIKPAATAPVLSSVSVTDRTSSSVTLSYTSDQAGTAYTARANIDQTAPTCDELEAQTYAQAVAYASEATSGGADSITHTSMTNGTVRDWYICVENAGGTDSAVTLVENVYKIPGWTSAPVVSAQSDTAYTIAKDLDGAGSTYAVACLKDSTAPTYAQVAAGNCTGDAAAIAAASGDGTSATLALGSGLTRPVHDIYVVGTYGGFESAVTTLADEMLDAPTGYQYDLLASISATSPCKELNDIPISPTIAAADVTKWSTTTSPTGYAFTAGTDCETQYTDHSGSRQTATIAVYDTSAGDWMSGTTTVYYNNSTPTCALSGCAYDTGADLINGLTMTAVDMATWFNEADVDDSLTITTSSTGTGTGADKIPAGTSITDGEWSGTPECASANTTGGFTATATDEAGDTETVDVTWTCYDQVVVPVCVGTTLSACGEAAALVNIDLSATLISDAGTAIGYVISQSIAAGTEVDPFSTLEIAVSMGAGGHQRRRTLGLGVGVGRFMPEIDFDTVLAVGGQ